MAYAAINSVGWQSSNTNGGTSASVNMIGADLLVVGTGEQGSFNSLTDSESNVYTALRGTPDYNGAGVSLHYCVGPTVSSAMTFTLGGTGTYPAMAASGWSGSHASPYDQVSSDANVFSTTIQPGSITPSEDDCLLVTFVETVTTDTVPSVSSPFAVLQAADGVSGICYGYGLAYEIQTTATARNPTWTVADFIEAAIMASFKAGAGGGGVTGAGAITLPLVEVAGSGVRTSKGTGAIALPEAQVAGAGVRTSKGAGAITLPLIEVAGVGERVVPGAGSITLPLIEVAGAGTVGAVITGAGAITLPAAEVAGSGVRTAKGTGNIPLPEIAVSGAGVRTAKGTGVITLPALVAAGAGVRTSNGAGAITLPLMAVDGAGNVFSGVGGSGALTFEAIQVSGAGIRGANGIGAITLPLLAVDGTGTVQTPATGSGNLLLPELAVSGAGTRGVVGTGAIFLPAMQVSGFEIPPTPGNAYKFINGTAFDQDGRMMTRFIDPGDPLPYTGNFIEGLAHDSGGKRYVTSWPGAAGYIGGFAVRPDGVQVIAADATPVRAIEGLGVTARGEATATDLLPVNAVGGFGTDALGRLSVTEKN